MLWLSGRISGKLYHYSLSPVQSLCSWTSKCRPLQCDHGLSKAIKASVSHITALESGITGGQERRDSSISECETTRKMLPDLKAAIINISVLSVNQMTVCNVKDVDKQV